MWDAITAGAAAESPLWADATMAEGEQNRELVFSPLAPEVHALGLETIYEGYLVHYGRSRLFAPGDRDMALLLGDYLYAHGLVRIAEQGEVAVVADLSDLLSLCAQLRAEPEPSDADDDGVLWAATFALVGSSDPSLVTARTALRDEGDPAPLASLAARVAGDDPVAAALALHRARLAV